MNIWIKISVLTTLTSLFYDYTNPLFLFLSLTVGEMPILVVLLFIHLTVLIPVFERHLGLLH